MSARMEDLPRLRRRFPRRRLFAYSALGLVALAIIAVLIGRLYIRSERFNRFLSIELEKALDRHRSGGPAHRKAIANRDHGDARLMDFGNQSHV